MEKKTSTHLKICKSNQVDQLQVKLICSKDMNLFRANDPISPFGCLCIIIQAASVIALAPMHRIVKNLAETNNRNNQRIIPRKLIYTYPPKNSNGFWRWLTIFWNGPFETRGPGGGGVSYQKKNLWTWTCHRVHWLWFPWTSWQNTWFTWVQQ